MVETQKSKPATYQKKINEMFPTLGTPEPKEEVKKVEVVKPEVKPEVKQEEKPWWQKINDNKKVEVDE